MIINNHKWFNMLKKTRKNTLLLILLGLILVALAVITYAFAISRKLPDPALFNERQVSQSTKIFDRTGKVLLYEVHGEEKRTVVPFTEISDNIKKATLAAEDVNFYNHAAFDWKSIGRAVLVNLVKMKIAQGGSTITQQLAKNSFLTTEKTATRKIKELILSIELERKYTKDEILNLYLNQIPYGSNAYGIEAASQTFFNKHASELSINEAATLAAMPKAPSYYSPYGSNSEALINRKNLVLKQMFDAGFITETEKNDSEKEKLIYAPSTTNIKAPYFVIMVQDYLIRKYGEDFIRNKGLKVKTTLDWNLQQIAEKAVFDGATRNESLYNGKNAALVSQDTTTGQILALVGGKDYFDINNDGNFNVATQGLRQPGSSIKPLAYITAFTKGYTPDTVVFDTETDFDTTGENPYIPQNFDNKFRGPVSLRQALAQSINVPAVKVLYLAGIDNTLKVAESFGITTLKDRTRYGLSLALGGGEIKLYDLVGAYSVFSQDGVKHKQNIILKIEDLDENTLEEYQDEATPVIDEQYPRLINDILSDVNVRRSLYDTSLNLTIFPGWDVALKTGTTNEYRDAWTLGYSPTLVTGVWAGNNDNTSMQKKGSSILAALPIWSAFMKEALKTQPQVKFIKPTPIDTEKPILRGDYLINNEIHDILYYVDKNNPGGAEPTNPKLDSQFESWEKGILSWLEKNPEKALSIYKEKNQNNIIDITSPKNGEYIPSLFNLKFSVNNNSPISKLEISLNNQIFSTQINLGNNFNYDQMINFPQINLQNTLKISLTDLNNQIVNKEIILYSN